MVNKSDINKKNLEFKMLLEQAQIITEQINKLSKEDKIQMI